MLSINSYIILVNYNTTSLSTELFSNNLIIGIGIVLVLYTSGCYCEASEKIYGKGQRQVSSRSYQIAAK